MARFDELAAKVQAETNAANAMAAVLKDVKDKLDAAISNADSLSEADKAQLQQIANDIDAETQNIVNATLANTPADTTVA